MSSYNRQHNGRGRPPPARNRTSYHPPQAAEQPHIDPSYLAYLSSQAEHLNNQLHALTRQQPPVSTRSQQTYQPQYQPPRVSRSSSSTLTPHTRRNPAREGSKWQFYAVKNGTHGNEVYSSWNQAYPFCWDSTTQYFYPGCICKGFNNYDDAWDFLLGVDAQDNQPSTEIQRL